MVACFPLLMSDSSDAVGYVPDPQYTIQIAEAKQSASIDKENGANLTYRGTVFVCMPWRPEMNYIVVNLTVDSGGFKATEVDQMTFTRAQRQMSFNFTVHVPAGTQAEKHMLRVGGEWSTIPPMESGKMIPSASLLEVLPYSDVKIKDEETKNHIVKAGSSVDIGVCIMNNGNFKDEISWEMEPGSQNELRGRGWVVIWNSTSSWVDGFSEISPVLKLSIPGDEEPGIYTFEIKALYTSKLIPSNESRNSTLISLEVLQNLQDELEGLAVFSSILLVIWVCVVTALMARLKRKNQG
ncbi:MAG: choice-of-anchor T family protein [Thermoplasmatota archaeon]